MKNLISLLIISLIISSFTIAQQLKSIHQIESKKYESQRLNKISSRGSVDDIIPLNKSVKKNLSHSVFGFYPYWEHPSAHSSFDYDLLTHIAVFDFEVTATGQLIPPDDNWPWTDFINEAHENGVKVVFSITNIYRTDTEMNSLYTNSFYRWAFMLGVQRIIRENKLDGVNIDFEGIPIEHRGDILYDFVQEVTDSVHSINSELEVSFASPPVDWEPDGSWNFLKLANSCDYLFLMGYDFFGSWSPTTGPSAPLVGPGRNITRSLNEEYKNVVTFFPDKLILGVPYYGPYWTTETASEGSKVNGFVKNIWYWEAKAKEEEKGMSWSSTYNNSWISFKEGDDHKQIWYDNDSSLGLKYDLAIQKKLKGIGMWALGYDRMRDELWNLISDKFSVPVSVEENDEILNQIELSQNYPNPFNPTTKIKYSIPNSGFNNGSLVQLKIYDVLGKNIKTLVDEYQQYGSYEVEFDGNNLTSGIYFYSLQVGNTIQSKKMLFIK